MKRIIAVCIFIVFSLTLGLRAGDKSELKWKSFDAGFAEAKKNKKKVMVDVYTDWCGWCKRLDKDTYSNEKVIDYLNHQYVVVKMNAESTSKVTYKDSSYTEATLSHVFGITGYPTVIFFDASGEPINSLGGYVNAERFLPIIQYIGGDYYKSMTWDEYQNNTKKVESKKD